MSDDLKTGIIGTRTDGGAQSEFDHLERCPICGDLFDKHILDQALHHAMPYHAPAAANDR